MAGEILIPQGKRFIPVSHFMKSNGLSYETVMFGVKSGQIKHIKTESGRVLIDTKPEADNTAVLKKIEGVEKLVLSLCKQLNTPMNGR